MFNWFRKKEKDTNTTDEALHVKEFDDTIARTILAEIKEEFGLDYQKQEYLTMRKIERFALKNSIYSFSKLHTLLHEDLQLKEDLINMLTVGETYFYREIGHFKILCDHMKHHNVHKILSAPCSSGEEVYSILIYLKEHFKTDLDLKITGIDINSLAISYANKACYSNRSISLLPTTIQKQYFRENETGQFCLDPSLKNYTHFQRANIFDTKLKNLGKFDIIFCRNMLIYFNDKQKETTINILRDVLEENGLLFVGHADIVHTPKGFEKHIIPDGSYYKKV